MLYDYLILSDELVHDRAFFFDRYCLEHFEVCTCLLELKKFYGNITNSANELCFRQDDDFNTLAVLEIVDMEKRR